MPDYFAMVEYGEGRGRTWFGPFSELADARTKAFNVLASGRFRREPPHLDLWGNLFKWAFYGTRYKDPTKGNLWQLDGDFFYDRELGNTTGIVDTGDLATTQQTEGESLDDSCFGPLEEDFCPDDNFPPPSDVRCIPDATIVSRGHIDPNGFHTEEGNPVPVHPGFVYDFVPFNIIVGVSLPAGETFVEDGGRVKSLKSSVWGIAGGARFSNGSNVPAITKADYGGSLWAGQWYTEGGELYGVDPNPFIGSVVPPLPEWPFMGPEGSYQTGVDNLGDGTPGPEFPQNTRGIAVQAFAVYTTPDGDVDGITLTKYYGGGGGPVKVYNLFVADVSVSEVLLTERLNPVGIPGDETVWDHKILVSWQGPVEDTGLDGWELIVVEERAAGEERDYNTVVIPGGPPINFYTAEAVNSKQTRGGKVLKAGTLNTIIRSVGGTSFSVYLNRIDRNGTRLRVAYKTFSLENYGPQGPHPISIRRSAAYNGEGLL